MNIPSNKALASFFFLSAAAVGGQAASISHDSSVLISSNSDFTVSLFDGKAGYAGSGAYAGATAPFGDGTVEAYQLVRNVDDGGGASTNNQIESYAERGVWLGLPSYSNETGLSDYELDRGDVWTVGDPDSRAADFGGGTWTMTGARNTVTSLNIAGFASGTVYFLVGGFDNPFTTAITMRGSDEEDLSATSGTIDPPPSRNMYVVAYSFDNGEGHYESLEFSYSGQAANRARYMGVVLDAKRFPGAVLVSPDYGATVPGPRVELEWVNDEGNTGSDVWVGTDPDALVKMLDAGESAANRTSYSYPVDAAGTYYWRVDNFLDGTPARSTVRTFIVEDSDGDGLPDAYELRHMGTAQGMHAAADNDVGGPDGLSNLEEYHLGTDPSNRDSDGDGLDDGAEREAGTDPTRPDSDGDGLLDGETISLDSSDPRFAGWAEAGIAYTKNGDQRTFRGEAAVGTDPTDADTDQDGLPDGVESNDGRFVDARATGTDPADPDSDGDGAWDWYEVAASFTDPNLASDKPNVPYPLPAPDAAGSGPVKVYIMAGQSNMVGYGQVAGDGPGTLETITGRENKFPNLVADEGNWLSRDDVHYHGVVSATGKGPLAPEVWGGNFGPELGFGQVMGYHHGEPVLLLKTSQGNRAIGFDFLPPGSKQYDWTDGNTYAGYGDHWRLHPIGGSPTIATWYAGKQYDDCFLSEEDMGPTEWADATDYPKPSWVTRGGLIYECTTVHTSSPSTEPGAGQSWQDHWKAYSIFNAADVLDNFAAEYPDWASRGFEIAGFVWWQGHRDQYNAPYPPRYEENLETLIKALRSDFERRYPGKGAAEAPFVVSSIAFGGETYDPESAYGQIWQGQMNIDDPSRHPEFEGNVKAFDALPYWRDASISPRGDQSFHYNWNAETYLLVGDAAGRAMVELLEDSGDAGSHSD